MVMRRQTRKDAATENMSRQETAIWLGRALSTNEVTLRVVLDLLDVVAFQQAALKQLTEQARERSLEKGSEEMVVGQELEEEVAQKVVEKLARWREELTPVLQAVENACQQCEKIISSS